MTEVRNEPQCTAPLPEASFGERQETRSDRRHFASPLLYDSRASSERDSRRSGASGSTRRDSTRLTGVWASGVLARCMPGLVTEGGGRDAVSFQCSKAALESLCSQRSGVIADFGDDAGSNVIAVRVRNRLELKSRLRLLC